MNRISRDEYGLKVAAAVALRADCTRRQVGAVIMDDEGRIVSTGYNGAPAGEPGCLTAGACPRGQLSYDEHPKDTGYETTKCIAVHAESNAVIYAGRDRTKGCTIYVTDEPCYLCAIVIKAAGIVRVVTPESHAVERVVEIAVETKEKLALAARAWPEVKAERAILDETACTCGHDGMSGSWHVTPCQIKVDWLALMRRIAFQERDTQ